jgi:HEAT repeat protein
MGRFRTARWVGLGCAVLAALFLALSVGLVVTVANAVSRITIDPVAWRQAVREWLVTALRDGTPDQRLQVIRALGDMGADAREFIPELVDALDDDDRRIRDAAAEALEKIDPDEAE